MTTLTQIYEELAQCAQGYDSPLAGMKAATLQMGGAHHVFLDTRRMSGCAEEKRIAAHELGHIQTGTTCAMGASEALVGRCEERAERWTIKRLLPYDSLCAALRAGYRTTWELAEYFDVPDELVHKAITYYTCACGRPLRCAPAEG